MWCPPIIFAVIPEFRVFPVQVTLDCQARYRKRTGEAEFFVEKQSEVGKNSVFPEVLTFFCVIGSEDQLFQS
jgi:hypothetical protein